jgi:hypothetical protein
MTTPYLSRDEMMGLRGPAIGLSDNRFGFFAGRIRAFQRRHNLGEYQHAFWLESPGTVVSQDWRLTRYSLAEYLRGAHRGKIIIGRRWSREDQDKIRRQLIVAVREGGRYDWLGILGQRLGIRALNFRRRAYCSEFVGSILRTVDPSFTNGHPTPSEINTYTKRRKHLYQVVGVYDPYDD